MTTREAAALLTVSDRHVRRLVQRGRLDARYANGRIYLFDHREVERELVRRKKASAERTAA